MAKGQKRSNREVKKPKQEKTPRSAAGLLPVLASGPAARESAAGGGRTGADRGRTGRR